MNTNLKASTRPGLHAAKKGFTLIELLVVITIIAILAGLLFPAMGAVRTQARKTSAKNDVTQIVNAVKAYYLEYGKYPVAPGQSSFGANNNDLFKVLALTSGTTDTLNPRGIRFLEIPSAKIQSNDTKSKSGLDTQKVWRDPWGHPYEIRIDTSYSGAIATFNLPIHTGQTGTPVTSGTLQTEVISFSKGNPDSKTPDPVMSWK